MRKLLAIVGPTATGKSDLAVLLAKKFRGEVVSADSRQVYWGLDIGTGKVPCDPQPKSSMQRATGYLHQGIPHHLLDIASPRRTFTVSHYQNRARKAIEKIWKNRKLPILCGGTGFYVRAVVDNIALPEVPPNKKLRERLEAKSIAELYEMLKKLDPRRAREIDRKNPRRLVRAIEIAQHLGKVPRLKQRLRDDRETLIVGIDMPDRELKARIKKRLDVRMKQGMVAEVKKLHRGGLSWRRMERLGLEYRYLARFLQGKITRVEMVRQLEREIWHYAKRQRTWFRNDKRILWFKPSQKKKMETLVKNFLRK